MSAHVRNAIEGVGSAQFVVCITQDKATKVMMHIRQRISLPCLQVLLPDRSGNKKLLPGTSQSGARSYSFDACLPGKTTQVCRKKFGWLYPYVELMTRAWHGLCMLFLCIFPPWQVFGMWLACTLHFPPSLLTGFIA